MEVIDDLDKSILKCSFGGQNLTEVKKKKEWNAKKWTQYKQPLFSLVAKENRVVAGRGHYPMFAQSWEQINREET